jgi:hypothetical protein
MVKKVNGRGKFGIRVVYKNGDIDVEWFTLKILQKQAYNKYMPRNSVDSVTKIIK